MKHLVRVLAFLCISTFVLGACAAPATTQPTVAPQVIVQTQIVKETQPPVVQTQIVEKPAAKTEIRLSGWVSSPAETALLESLLYQFSVAHPDIVVKYEPITGDYNATLKTAVASGTEPDVFYMDIFQFPAFAKDDVMLPLDDLMAQTGTKKDDFVPSLINAFTADGKTYGIPKDFNTLGLFYNKDLFAAAKLAEPTDNWTWDDLTNAAQKLTNLSDSKKPVYGLGVPSDAGRFPVFVFQAGGSIMKPDFTDTTLDGPEAVAAAQFYTDFRKNKTGALPSDVGEGWQGTVFGKGQFAMVYEGGWLIPYLSASFPNTHYGVVMPPAGPKGKGNLIFTVAWVISKNSKHPNEAWQVIDFLTNPDSQKTVLESGFALPSRTALKDSDYLKNNPNAAELFNGASVSAQPFMWGVVGSDVNDQMGKALDNIYKNNMAPADALKDAAKKIRDAISSAK